MDSGSGWNERVRRVLAACLAGAALGACSTPQAAPSNSTAAPSIASPAATPSPAATQTPAATVSPAPTATAVPTPSLVPGLIPSGSGVPVVKHGPRDVKAVALTFDADMTPWMADQLASGAVKSYVNRDLLKLLDKAKVPSTMFLAGLWMKAYPDLTRKLAANPLVELGTHSWSHPAFTQSCFGLPTMPRRGPLAEVMKAQDLLDRLAGPASTRYFRFPGGCYDAKALRDIRKSRVTAVGWDSAGSDGHAPSANSIASAALSTVKPGSIVVLHMNGAPITPLTDEGVAIIIKKLRARGYEFVTLSQLLK